MKKEKEKSKKENAEESGDESDKILEEDMKLVYAQPNAYIPPEVSLNRPKS